MVEIVDDVVVPDETEVSEIETTTEVSAYPIIVEYVPKIYVMSLLIFCALIFGFIYLVIKNNITKHFV